MKFDEKVSYFLKKYLGRIKSIYKPDELWLWGSRAYGKPDEFSDIDLIIVSDKFFNVKFTRRMYEFIDSIGLLNDRTVETVDVLCYTPAEFLKKKSQVSIINEAVRKGIRII